MTLKLPIGVDDFKKAIEENYTLVDKTLFIKDIIDDAAEVVLITRPRRFGKTLNMSMLYYFFSMANEDRSHLFHNMAIEKEKKYRKEQGKYPVIFLTFKAVKFDSLEDSFIEIQKILSTQNTK